VDSSGSGEIVHFISREELLSEGENDSVSVGGGVALEWGKGMEATTAFDSSFSVIGRDVGAG
jgi:hypothetical protein